jgi:hypothetical protein
MKRADELMAMAREPEPLEAFAEGLADALGYYDEKRVDMPGFNDSGRCAMSGIKYEKLTGKDLIAALRGGACGDLLEDAGYAAADEIERLQGFIEGLADGDEIERLQADIERLRVALSDADRAVSESWGYGHTLRKLLLVARDCLRTAHNGWAETLGREIDAFLGATAVQPERCCLDYPRCDCNSPSEPDSISDSAEVKP